MRGERPAGAEIYRAALAADGSQGKYRKVGVCKKLKQARYREWRFSYRDNTVKAGQRYIYKYKRFIHVGAVKTVQKNNCLTGTGIAEKSSEGNYTCKVVKSTKKKLIVKVAGISKKCIGVLSPATSNPAYLAGWPAKTSGKRILLKAAFEESVQNRERRIIIMKSRITKLPKNYLVDCYYSQPTVMTDHFLLSVILPVNLQQPGNIHKFCTQCLWHPARKIPALLIAHAFRKNICFAARIFD